VDGIGSVVFDANFPPEGSVLMIAGGDHQVASYGSDTLPDLLRVRAQGEDGTPLAGITVTWQITAGNGALRTETSLTNSNGIASNRWLLAAVPDTQRVVAAIGGVGSAAFRATAVDGPAISDIRFTPLQVFSGAEPDTVTVTWHVRSPAGARFNLSGVETWAGSFHQVACWDGMAPGTGTVPELVSGTMNDGEWRCTIIYPRNNGPMLMEVRVIMYDVNGRMTKRSAPTYLIRNDWDGPTVDLKYAQPTPIYSAAAPKMVTLRWRAIDPVGVAGQYLLLFEGPHAREGCGRLDTPMTPISGTAFNGLYECKFMVSGTTPASLEVRIVSQDYAGNTTTYRAMDRMQRNDWTAPVVSEITASPSGDVPQTTENSPTPITIEWRAQDPSVVGQQAGELWTHPPETCTVDCSPRLTHQCTATRISGTSRDGVYRCVITVSNLTGTRSVRIYSADAGGNNVRVMSNFLIISSD
jgi:hypothetical protein